MKAEIKVITDNIPGGGLGAEWGLCLLIDFEGTKILLDAGASDLFLGNMRSLGERPEDVDFAVLSHAHYDHANGMPAFFENNTKAKLLVRETTASDCFKKVFIFKKYIGIPERLLDEYADRIETVAGNYEFAPGAFLVPHTTGNLSEIGRRESMCRKTKRGWIPDDFSHEQSLVLDTDKGLLIFNSCSHGGVANIINEVKAAFPEKPICGYIGGFHLFNKSEEEIRRVAGALKATSLEYICTGHCTGEKAFAILKNELGDRAEQLHAGKNIIL